MLDDIYKNAFKEVYDILQYTDAELLNKVPDKFISFIKNNMNSNYITNITPDVQLSNQNLLKETECILSLIYRSYWATDEEKLEFEKKDKEEFLKMKEVQSNNIKAQNIEDIFAKRKNINTVTIDNNLMVIPKENFIRKFFKKLLYIFKGK